MLDPLLERFGKRDRLALARLISLLARGEHSAEILQKIPAAVRPSRLVAVTGSGGVGKSTLIGKLIERLREQGQTVAVLACDPESPLSGGALLGDRFRMPSRPDDDGVFIRSLAASAGHGAVAQNLAAIIRLVESFGFDLVILETVGAGQGDTAVRQLADVVVLLLQPETGDDLQWEKAGVLEVADIVVIHKADLPGAESAAAQVRASLDLSGAAPIPVIRVSAKSGAGMEDLLRSLAECASRRSAPRSERELLRLAQQTLAARFGQAEAAEDQRLQALTAAWQRGELDPQSAGTRLLELLSEQRSPSAPR